MRIVILRNQSRKKIIIKRVYYISNLEANLLLYKRLYMLDLKERFNINFIYLQLNNIDIFKANYKKEVYILI